MLLVDLNYNFEFDWFVELSDNKLSDNKLSDNNLASELVGIRSCLRAVPTIVIAHMFCASSDTRISYRQCLLVQGYFCAI